jgi:hypothetical protein
MIRPKTAEERVGTPGLRPCGELRIRRIAVGLANLALAAMLFYGVYRFSRDVMPVYGNRFAYVPIAMAGLACWRGAIGVILLSGRRSGR